MENKHLHILVAECTQGVECKFAHVDAYGQSWQEHNANDASPSAGRGKQTAPWKKARSDDVVSIPESQVSVASVPSHGSSMGGNIFEWEPGDTDRRPIIGCIRNGNAHQETLQSLSEMPSNSK